MFNIILTDISPGFSQKSLTLIYLNYIFLYITAHIKIYLRFILEIICKSSKNNSNFLQMSHWNS